MIRSHALLATLLGLGLACATKTTDAPTEQVAAPTEPTADEADEPSAVQTLTELERRLQEAERVEIAFETVSEGTIASKLNGTLVWSRDGELRLLAKGEFAGQPQQLEVRADATTIEVFVGGASRHSGPRPGKLVEAVVLGLLRQGVLHNLAMATNGQPPSFGDGGFDQWMQTIEHRFVADGALEFDIEVQGQNIAHASLQLNAEGLPVERKQTVEFPEGQMRVVERYTIFAVNPPEPVVKIPSVLDRLRGELEGETVAIAVDREAVFAMGTSGRKIERPWLTLFVGPESRAEPRLDKCKVHGCDISEGSLPLLRAVYQQREVGAGALEIPDRAAYSVIESEALCSKCGRFIPIPHTEIGLISVFSQGRYSHVLWMLYDPKSDVLDVD